MSKGCFSLLPINETEQIAIQKLYSSIKEDFKVVKMVLFGSKARGDAEEYSDIDLLVLTEKIRDIRDRLKLSDIATDVSIDYGIAISCLYMNYRDWEQGNVNPLLKQNIEKEGIEIVLQ